MRGLFTAAATSFLTGIVARKANSPGQPETKTMAFARHRIFIGSKNQKNLPPENSY